MPIRQEVEYNDTLLEPCILWAGDHSFPIQSIEVAFIDCAEAPCSYEGWLSIASALDRSTQWPVGHVCPTKADVAIFFFEVPSMFTQTMLGRSAKLSNKHIEVFPTDLVTINVFYLHWYRQYVPHTNCSTIWVPLLLASHPVPIIHSNFRSEGDIGSGYLRDQNHRVSLHHYSHDIWHSKYHSQ